MSKKILKIIPLGGFGEVGKNMLAYEYGEEILVVDAGLMFPENDMLGIDYIIPDFNYLVRNKKKVRGIVITHGHEDHTGAITHLLEQVNVPIYATPLTRGLIEVKLAKSGLIKHAQLRTVHAGESAQIGCFKVEFFHVSHSIPDSVGLGIDTPAGLIVHSGDYKFDHTPVDSWPSDYAKLAEFSQRGVLALLADSTNVEKPGWAPSERVIDGALAQVFDQAPGRIIVATFASHISRIQQVANAAVSHKRKIAFIGTSMVENVKIARQLDYLELDESMVVPADNALHMPDKEVVLMVTGSQGEPTSIMGRLSAGTNRTFDIKEGDTVVLSASPIPGNEESVYRVINHLFQRGANVIYGSTAPVHVSGHASQEEMKLLISLTQPKFFIPMHGELRMLKLHGQLAESLGIPVENIAVVENGRVIELENHGKLEHARMRLGERLPGGYVFVDGSSVGDVNQKVINERENLGRDGVLMIILSVDKHNRRLRNPAEIFSSGLLPNEAMQEYMPALRKRIDDAVRKPEGNLQQNVEETVKNFIYRELERRPVIFVNLNMV
ncbi:MAG: ribonuclease J [Anaerolineaceae bacterium]